MVLIDYTRKEKLVKYVEAHPLNLADIVIADKRVIATDDDINRCMDIPPRYKICYSIELQVRASLKHLIIQSTDNTTPTPNDCYFICDCLGFKVGECHFMVEEIKVNVYQIIEKYS